MSNKRRNYLTNIPFQSKFILAFVLVAFFGNILAVTVFDYLALEKLDALVWSTHLRVETTSDIIGMLLIQVNMAAFIFICVSIIITGILMIRRVSGPLYRMSEDIRKVADGDMTVDIALRQRDEFRDVASELDNAVESLRSRFISLKEKYGDISKSIEDLKWNMKDNKARTDVCMNIINNIDILETEMNKFKLRSRRERE
jgi:methyl-accepting chemotaxis protein